MILLTLLNTKFIISYLVFNTLAALYVYVNMKTFIKSQQKSGKSDDSQNAHDSYPEWRKNDSKHYPFIRILFGFIFFVWIKFSLNIIMTGVYLLYLKIFLRKNKANENTTSEWERNKLIFGSRLLLGSARMALGLFNWRVIKKKEWEAVYKSKLGEDYFETDRSKFSIVISNHISWTDPYHFGTIVCPGFVAKKSVDHMPFVGYLARTVGCLFVDRNNNESRKSIAEKIRERQINFFEGKTNSPLLVFPEGTTSNGEYLLSFKKGAFEALLPIKPYLMKLNPEEFSISEGCMDLNVHVFLLLCFLYHNYEIYELPVIYPTEEMFKRYKGNKTEKWEIFAEVTREIYSEIGGLKLSNKSFEDGLKYVSILKNEVDKKK